MPVDIARPQPHHYPRRVLISISGLSPQVVTETVFGLTQSWKPPFHPTEVHLVTTAEGAERARLTLLSSGSAWFDHLCRDWEIPRPEFSESHFHLIHDHAGNEIHDLRTAPDNEAAADTIIEIIRHFTEPDDTAVHVSIAGGRKTMGFFAGYALSLLGRNQDSLSHVLVSSEFESNQNFFYPSRQPRVIYTQDLDPRPLDASKGIVTLAEIPFVRLRPFLSQRQLKSTLTFRQAVKAANAGLSETSLTIDLSGGRILAFGDAIRLSPTTLAFLAWFARRRVMSMGPVACPSDGAPDQEFANQYLAEYNLTSSAASAKQRTAQILAAGMEKSFFLEKKSKLHRELTASLGFKAEAFFVRNRGSRPETKYELAISSDSIQFLVIPSTISNS